MATRREHRQAMREQFGDYLTVADVARYLGVNRRTAERFLEQENIEGDMIVGRKKYSAIDIARCLAH